MKGIGKKKETRKLEIEGDRSDPGPVRRCGNHHDFYHDCQRGGSEWFQHGSGTETEGRQGGFFIGLLF